MTGNDQVQQIELSIEEARKIVKRRDMAQKLASNREFRKLILEFYFVDEAARLVGLLSEEETKANREDIQDMMKGIAYLRLFLRQTIQMGNIAAAELADLNEALDEINEEEDLDQEDQDDDESEV
jgi:hypothetical protein